MYGKTFVMVMSVILSAVIAALSDSYVDSVEALNITLAALGAIATWFVPNLTAGSAKYAKAIVVVLTAVATLAVDLISNGITLSEWLQLAVVGLGALIVPIPRAPQYNAIPVVLTSAKY